MIWALHKKNDIAALCDFTGQLRASKTLRSGEPTTHRGGSINGVSLEKTPVPSNTCVDAEEEKELVGLSSWAASVLSLGRG